MIKVSDELPLVSVIVPCYNSGRYIKDTLASVLNQSYGNIEIIAVDDESSDDTFKILEDAAQNDQRIKPYQIAHSGRPSVPRNFGISKATGSLIAFLDSDDIWVRNKLQQQTAYLLKHTETAFVYSMSFTFGDVNFFSEHYELLPLPFRAAKNASDLREIGNTITLSSVLVRKEALDETGYFDEDPDLKAVEDYDLWLRLSGKFKFYFMPVIQVYYRIHGTQSSAGWEVREKRLQLLSAKRNIKLPVYKNLRRKGKLLLLIRNTIHFMFYRLYRLYGWFEGGGRG